MDGSGGRYRGRGPGARSVLVAAALLAIGSLLAQDGGGAEATDGEDAAAGPGTDAPRGGMIPRAALVDITRNQSAALCSSEIFLGCMGFDGGKCLALSESAIDRCLMPLPPEIDPTTLENATLEACPAEVYREAGYEEAKAQECLAEALGEP